MLCRGSILAFMTSLVSLAAAVEVPELEENHIFMPPWGFGLMAFTIFLLLFALLWAFRNTAARFGAPRGQGHHGGPAPESHKKHGASH